MSLDAVRALAPDALEQALVDARSRGLETEGKLFVCFDLHTPPGPLLAVETLMGEGKTADEAVAEVRSKMEADDEAGEYPCAAALVDPGRFLSFLESVVLPSNVGADLLEAVRDFAATRLAPGYFPVALVAGLSIRLDVLRVGVDRHVN